MRVFITVLVLIFRLQSWANADDIRDLQIEGMSIGDSLLIYFSEREINNYKIKIHNSDRYTSINYKNNIDMCYKKIDNIYKEIKSIVPSLNDEGKLKYKHGGDKTGKSIITDYVFENNKNDEIQIACYDYSENYGGNDNLRVGIRLIDYRTFLRNEAYK